MESTTFANLRSAASLQGRTGGELAASYARTDLTRVGKCVPASLKFTHGDPHEPPVQCYATVNQLAFGEQQLLQRPYAVLVSTLCTAACDVLSWG
jgi:hypothetical protein